MKAEELRIGNYVNIKDWQDEISFFGEFDISQDQLDNLINKGDGYVIVKSIGYDVELVAYGCNIDFYAYNEIEPIPLTKEWLLKLGFEKSDITGFDMCFINNNINRYVIQKMCDKWTLFIRIDNDNLELLLGFDHVHQLQNLYYALTKEELKLKL